MAALLELRVMLHDADATLCRLGRHWTARRAAVDLEVAKVGQRKLAVEKAKAKASLNTHYERLFEKADGDMKAVFAADPLLMSFSHHQPKQPQPQPDPA